MGIAKMAKEHLHHQEYPNSYPGFPSLQPQPLSSHLAFGFRSPNHRHLHAPPLLQRCRWATWGLRILAPHCIFPHRDVHSTEENPQMEHQMDLPPNPKRHLPNNIYHCRCRLRSRRRPRSQSLSTV
eukprot:TRINITY_DN1833_c2_g4_i1.p2 TRINITY_DN1833_c2_g4~~TRINITY_DN1833_c2_g4_i1.p2  ORF type:complete len:126 (+),score=1.57 TRINITY_DN1833_c2_g4_i1:174-551(+)